MARTEDPTHDGFEGVVRRRIAVVALGDPRDHRVWSGHPANLVPALERQGFEVVGIDAGTRGWRCLPWALRYHARRWWHSPWRSKVDLRVQRTLLAPGHRADLHWDLRLRERRSRNAEAQVRAAGIDTVLHMTPNAIPLGPWEGIRQWASIDATWASQTSYRIPGGPGRYPPRLVEEGDRHERRSHAHLEHVFGQGSWFEQRLLELGLEPGRTTNLGTGIPGNACGRAPEDERVPGRMLAVVKDLLDERGVTASVAALQIARRTDPRLHLVLMGSDEGTRRFGDVPGVEAHRYVPRAQLDRELERSSLFVQPAAYMVWGMAYLEALGASMPILALDRCATPEITEDGAFGFLVEEMDPDLIAVAMLDAFSDERRLRKMGEEGRRSVRRRFSWEGVAAKMAAVIREAGEPRP